MKPPNPDFINAKKLIQKFIHKNDIIWGREIKLAKKLLKLYPLEFWEQYDPAINIYSLSIFLTPSAKKEINKQFEIWNLTKEKIPVVLEDKPVIEIDFVEKKNKKRTLLEFVDEVL